MNQKELEKIQKTIGYNFKNTDLLQQAFVRKSYSAENGGENNEILEFIGDKALDFVVIRVLMQQYGRITIQSEYKEFKTKYSEGKFTEIKKDLVQKQALAKAIQKLELHHYLIMGHGDRLQNRQNVSSIKEDLFEAILGAVAIDSNWNMHVLTTVVKKMIDFNRYFGQEMATSINYIDWVQQFFQQHEHELPRYQFLNAVENTVGERCRRAHQLGSGWQKCQLIYSNLYFNGLGNSNAEAKKNCARCFYEWIQKNSLFNLQNRQKSKYNKILYKIKEKEIVRQVQSSICSCNRENLIGLEECKEAIRLLNEIYQNGFITQPIYKYQKVEDRQGAFWWECSCYIENYAMQKAIELSKKDAQRKAAYLTLCQLSQRGLQ